MAELGKELDTYNEHLSELLKDEGKFVVIHEGDIAGVFRDFEDALTQGYEKFGLEPFLLKKIESIETVEFA